MKFLSVLLLFSVLYLSAFAAMAPNNMDKPSKPDCCHKTDGKMACDKNKPANKGCDEPGCAMMLSCDMCGFVVVEPFTIQSLFADYLLKPVSLYKIGELSSFSLFSWKPPKTC